MINYELSKYILHTVSNDQKYDLLYNTKNDYFVRINRKDFKNLDEVMENEKVREFFREKRFFVEDNEIEYINNQHKIALESSETLMLIIKLTRECNLRCTYCYENFSREKIDITEINKIVNFIRSRIQEGKIKRLIINWFGGEPTMNIDAIEILTKKIVEICSNNDVQLISSITTNGLLLNKETFIRLLYNYVTSFQITIDGSKKIHDQQRIQKDGLPSFDIIKKNLMDIKGVKDKRFAVVLRTNISKKVLEDIDQFEKDFLQDFKDADNFYLDFQPVVDFSTVKRLVDDYTILELIKKYMSKGYKFIDIRRHISVYSSACYAMKDNHYVIDSKCNVSRCTVANDEFSYVGKIDDNGKIIFNSNNLLWNAARKKNKCNECKRYAFCGGGVCPLYYLKNDNTRCNRYTGKEEDIVKIMDLQKSYDLTLKKK